jgi:adenylate kinase
MIVFMGIAGAGKGTQSQLLTQERGGVWISTGELFRAAIANGKYPDYFKGKLISDSDTIELLTEAFHKVDPGQEIVLDGFPRNLSQTKWLIDQAGTKNCGKITVMHLHISKEVTLERLKLRHRIDDTDEAIHQRFKDYESESGPIVALFKQHGIQVCDIDGDNTVEEVHRSVLQCLAKDYTPAHEDES